MARKINPQQLRFVLSFVTCTDATEAAKAAGYSAKTAGQQGWQLLQKPLVAAEIQRRFKAIADGVEVRQRDVIAGLLREATYYGPGSTPGERRRAWRDIGLFLGMGKFTVTVNQQMTPPHANPELRDLIRTLPADKLKQFHELMGLLAEARKAKLIEHEPAVQTEMGPR